jgi:hypothetical protein
MLSLSLSVFGSNHVLLLGMIAHQTGKPSTRLVLVGL